jgi:hypothetical protein
LSSSQGEGKHAAEAINTRRSELFPAMPKAWRARENSDAENPPSPKQLHFGQYRVRRGRPCDRLKKINGGGYS